MHAPLSQNESSGYIYVYKISEDATGQEGVYYKVGRTTNLTRRLYQWSRSCPYTPHLIEFFPSPPNHGSGGLRRTASNASISSLFRRGEINERAQSDSGKRMTRCVVTHRVERLIHLELEDRFGRVDISPNGGCACGKTHREWFRGGKERDGRSDSGKGEWEAVRDVIVRWVAFARIAYGEEIV
jgi:T5orf172 domain